MRLWPRWCFRCSVLDLDLYALRHSQLWIRVAEARRERLNALLAQLVARARRPLPPPPPPADEALPGPPSPPQLIFAFICWTLVADNAADSRFSYTIFVGTTTMAGAGLVIYAYTHNAQWAHGWAILALDCVWWCLWLGAAAALSATQTQRAFEGAAAARLRAAEAFAWMTWILYCTTVGLDAGDLAGGRARIVSLPNPIVADIEGRVVITSPWAGAPGTSAGPPGVMLAPLAAPAGPAPGGLLRAV